MTGPAHTTYTLGTRSRRAADVKSPLLIRRPASVYAGWRVWARDEAKGHYVEVLEYGPTEFVQGEPQAWSVGTFETRDSAIDAASQAYRYINKNMKAAA